MAWPITRTDLAGFLGTTPSSPTDTAHADRCVGAAVAFVEQHRADLFALVDTDGDGVGDTAPPPPPPTVELGAVMLAARWYARRGSPTGVVSYGDLGAAYVSRTDPDVARLLGLGKASVG